MSCLAKGVPRCVLRWQVRPLFLDTELWFDLVCANCWTRYRSIGFDSIGKTSMPLSSILNALYDAEKKAGEEIVEHVCGSSIEGWFD